MERARVGADHLFRLAVEFWGGSPGVGIGNLQESGNQNLDGIIGEAHISDMALDPSRFLGASAVPEPASVALASLGLVATSRARRKTWRAPHVLLDVVIA